MPRTQQLEEAILNSFITPLFSVDFDTEAERVTLRILETLAKYEGIEGIDRDTVQQIVINDALRKKLRTERDVEKQITLVKEALVDENIKLTKRLHQDQKNTRQYKKEVAEREETLKVDHEFQLRQAKIEAKQNKLRGLERERTILDQIKQGLDKKADDSAFRLLRVIAAVLVVLFFGGGYVLHMLDWDKIEWIISYVFGFPLSSYIFFLIYYIWSKKEFALSPRRIKEGFKKKKKNKLYNQHSVDLDQLEKITQEIEGVKVEIVELEQRGQGYAGVKMRESGAVHEMRDP